MKTFNTPYVEVIKFTVCDVLTTSGEEEEEGGNSDMKLSGSRCISA